MMKKRNFILSKNEKTKFKKKKRTQHGERNTNGMASIFFIKSEFTDKSSHNHVR